MKDQLKLRRKIQLQGSGEDFSQSELSYLPLYQLVELPSNSLLTNIPYVIDCLESKTVGHGQTLRSIIQLLKDLLRTEFDFSEELRISDEETCWLLKIKTLATNSTHVGGHCVESLKKSRVSSPLLFKIIQKYEDIDEVLEIAYKNLLLSCSEVGSFETFIEDNPELSSTHQRSFLWYLLRQVCDFSRYRRVFFKFSMVLQNKVLTDLLKNREDFLVVGQILRSYPLKEVYRDKVEELINERFQHFFNDAVELVYTPEGRNELLQAIDCGFRQEVLELLRRATHLDLDGWSILTIREGFELIQAHDNECEYSLNQNYQALLNKGLSDLSILSFLQALAPQIFSSSRLYNLLLPRLDQDLSLSMLFNSVPELGHVGSSSFISFLICQASENNEYENLFVTILEIFLKNKNIKALCVDEESRKAIFNILAKSFAVKKPASKTLLHNPAIQQLLIYLDKLSPANGAVQPTQSIISPNDFCLTQFLAESREIEGQRKGCRLVELDSYLASTGYMASPEDLKAFDNAVMSPWLRQNLRRLICLCSGLYEDFSLRSWNRIETEDIANKVLEAGIMLFKVHTDYRAGFFQQVHFDRIHESLTLYAREEQGRYSPFIFQLLQFTQSWLRDYQMDEVVPLSLRLAPDPERGFLLYSYAPFRKFLNS